MAADNVRFELTGDAHQQTVNYDGKEITVGKEGIETDDGGLIAALEAAPALKRSGAGNGRRKAAD